jgi:glycosyltransferase involved in cell wall biosynthesis
MKLNEKAALIMCDMFPPAFGPRMGYLCKYLRKNGWKPVVVAEFIDDAFFSFLEKEVDVTYVRYYRRTGFARKVEWVITLLLDMLFGYKDRRIYRTALKIARRQRFDVLLCSSFRTFPLPAAHRLSRRTGLPLIVDLRDIIEQYTGNEFIAHALPRLFGLERIAVDLFRRRSLAVRNKILRSAAAAVTISPWHVSVLKAFNADTHLIYNGYDPEIFYPAPVAAERFYITYTGRVFNFTVRDPSLLFQAVERLAGEKVITADSFRVRWFVDDKSRRLLANAVGEYGGISDFMEYSGYVPAERIPAILNESAILLLLTNRAGVEGSHGTMTTKFFESLAVGKPILCVRGDGGCLEEAIRSTRSGLAAHHVDEVYDFIKSHYLRRQSGQAYAGNADMEAVGRFSRARQARQFIDLFEEVINGRCNKTAGF